MEKKQVKRITYTAVIVVILIVINFTYKNFITYKNTIINQQIEHLHITSESVGRSIKIYIEEKEKGINILGKLIQEDQFSKAQKVKLLKNYYNIHEDEIASVAYIEENLVLGFPEYDREYFEDIPLGRGLKKRDHNYFLTIKVKVEDGYLISEIELDKLHNLIVKPIKVGKSGYAVLKNLDGEILMHPEKDHIGEDMVSYRLSKYPEVNLEEVSKLKEKQKLEESGNYIYTSYWWGEEPLKKVKKISVFSRVDILSNPWVVSMIISYDEVEDPILKYLIQSIIISIAIIFAAVGIIFFIAKTLTSKEKYRIEMKYLKELNKSNEKLRVKEAELHHSRKLEAIGKLTRGISHEFNNVLTPIIGYSEILLNVLDPKERTYKYSEGIYKSSKRAKEIIEQIRLFGGDKGVVYTSLDIVEVFKEALELVETTLPKEISMEVSIPDNKNYIYGNETNIHQVILNICSNAVHAMNNQDKGVLMVEYTTTGNEEEMAKLSFTDNGCGMTNETKERIFDPFFTKKLNDKGSGIGLAVVQGIVENHGGSIEVESRFKEGTTFHIYLPITKIQNTEFHTESSNITGKEKVLIVDDEQEIAELISESLEEYGYSTTKYTDSVEVMKRCKGIVDKYDVIVTDLSMPEVDGITLARRLKKKGDIKIILITASSHAPLEEYLREGIIDDYLLKPVTPKKIAQSIRELL